MPLIRYSSLCTAKSWVFSADLKLSVHRAGSWRESGSEFHSIGPETEKARQPNSQKVVLLRLINCRFIITVIIQHALWNKNSALSMERTSTLFRDFDLTIRLNVVIDFKGFLYRLHLVCKVISFNFLVLSSIYFGNNQSLIQWLALILILVLEALPWYVPCHRVFLTKTRLKSYWFCRLTLISWLIY